MIVLKIGKTITREINKYVTVFNKRNAKQIEPVFSWWASEADLYER